MATSNKFNSNKKLFTVLFAICFSTVGAAQGFDLGNLAAEYNADINPSDLGSMIISLPSSNSIPAVQKAETVAEAIVDIAIADVQQGPVAALETAVKEAPVVLEIINTPAAPADTTSKALACLKNLYQNSTNYVSAHRKECAIGAAVVIAACIAIYVIAKKSNKKQEKN